MYCINRKKNVHNSEVNLPENLRVVTVPLQSKMTRFDFKWVKKISKASSF